VRDILPKYLFGCRPSSIQPCQRLVESSKRRTPSLLPLRNLTWSLRHGGGLAEPGRGVGPSRVGYGSRRMILSNSSRNRAINYAYARLSKAVMPNATCWVRNICYIIHTPVMRAWAFVDSTPLGSRMTHRHHFQRGCTAFETRAIKLST
jgi:hypothetical protein